jgi:hypothetical protein
VSAGIPGMCIISKSVVAPVKCSEGHHCQSDSVNRARLNRLNRRQTVTSLGRWYTRTGNHGDRIAGARYVGEVG